VHHHVHFALVAADGDAPGEPGVDVNGFEQALDADGRFAGVDEIPRFDEETFSRPAMMIGPWGFPLFAAPATRTAVSSDRN